MGRSACCEKVGLKKGRSACCEKVGLKKGRSACCEKVGLKKGRWSAEEDEILTNYIKPNGEGSWRSLPKNAGLLRCGKSCRLRWINYLKRGNITPHEEEVFVKLHSALGNRWSLIASQLPGRTDNEIKNYWNSHLSRKIYSFSKTIKDTKPTHLPAITTAVDHHQRKRKPGRTSRSAMKRQKLALMSLRNKSTVTPKETLDCSTHNNAARPEGNYGEKSSEKKVMGPDEWLDNEIKRLSGILQTRQVVDQSGNYGLDLAFNGGNGVIFSVDEVLKDVQNDGVRSSSSTEITYHRGDELKVCNSSSSTGNSGFGSNDGDLQWGDIDDQWELLWNDSDKVLRWLWDDEIGKSPN